jgi:hypothetical protein
VPEDLGYNGGEQVAATQEQRAIETVKNDFSRAEEYLKNFHKQGIERYKHYVAPGEEINLKKDGIFPVPFITEQVDTSTADAMEKLWHKDEPCSIYGANPDDKADADAKREYMRYQDDRDGIHEKTRAAWHHCLIYKMAPAVVNYKEEFDIVTEMRIQPRLDEFGNEILGFDGEPVNDPVPTKVKKYTYQGATVELVDPIDFFFTKEKRELYDEHPLMIRQRHSYQWFTEKTYFDQTEVKKLLTDLKEGSTQSPEIEDLLGERRSILHYTEEGMDPEKKGTEYTYIEWQGYFKTDESDNKELYIIGVVDDRIMVRFQRHKDVFDLGHPNIVVGNVGKVYGEIYGLSLVDKIHSVQHGMDQLVGIWMASLRQTGNPMWAGNSAKMKTKRLVNSAGNFIDCMDDPRKVLQRIEVENISKDIYNGIQMFRDMGQNATGINDTSSGIAQEGVETLGEARILTSQTALRMKGGYLRSYEKSFIEPLWQMRNQINTKFCTDPGYMYSVLEDDVQNWRTLTPSQIKSEVDFVCEASARETQRAVITQQILQALNLTIKMADVVGPIPLVKLLERLYEEGFGWKQDDISELLPLEAIAENLVQREAAEQQKLRGENPQNMPQPITEEGALQSANAQNQVNVGEIG